MKSIYLTFLCLILSFTLSAQSWQYAQSFGGMHGETSNPHNQPHNMVVDDYGNTYVYGTYGNLAAFGDSTLPYFTDNTRGAFLVKFNCQGEAEWFKSIAHTEQYNNSASYMFIENDVLYLAGTVSIDNFYKTWFLDTLVIGSVLYEDYPDGCTFPWVPHNNYTYVMQYDLNGNMLDYDLLQFCVDDLSKISGYRWLWNNPQIQIPFRQDNQGNYYMFAKLLNTQKVSLFHNEDVISDTIFPLIPSATGLPQYSSIYYMLKFDTDFNLLWYKPVFEGNSFNEINSLSLTVNEMELDSENNLYLAGSMYFSDSDIPESELPLQVDVGNGQGFELFGHNSNIGYLMKMDSSGNVLWTQQTEQYSEEGYMSASSSEFESIIIDEETQCVYVEGKVVPSAPNGVWLGTVIEGDTIENTSMWANRMGIIIKYDMSGNHIWHTSPNSSMTTTGSIALKDGVLYSSVVWIEWLDHGEYYSENDEDYQLAVCSWDTDGNPLDVLEMTSTCSSPAILKPFDTRVNNMGEIFVSGTYDYGLTFGEHYIYGDGYKMFVAKYGNPCPVIHEESISFCYGDEYNGDILTSSGDYSFVFESSQPGVDSVVLLHASVHPELSTGISDTTVCVNETYTFTANAGYNSYEWSTGSISENETLSFDSPGEHCVYVSLSDDYCSGIDSINFTVEICDNLNEESISDVQLYPVPVSQHLNVTMPEGERAIHWQVFNLQGQLLSAGSNPDELLSIDLSSLPAGSYMLRLQSETQIYSKVFMKD